MITPNNAPRTSAPGTRPSAAMLVGGLYFALVPITQARLVRFGPMSIVGFVGIAAAAMLSTRACLNRRGWRLWHDRAWVLPSSLMGLAMAIGVIRGPDVATGYIRELIQFAVTAWLLISLAPSRDAIGSWLRAGIIGLATSGAIGLYLQRAYKFTPAYEGETLSRMVVHQQDWGIAFELGVAGPVTCMVMAIAGVLAIGFAIVAHMPGTRVLWGVAGGVLLLAQAQGGFVTSNVLSLTGVVALAGFSLPYGRKPLLSVVLTCVLLGGGLTVIATADSTVGRRLDVIAGNGVGSDDSGRGRIDAFLKSAEAFARNPLLGIGFEGWRAQGSMIGGHSSIIDVPAQLGMVGAIAYPMMLLWPALRAWRARRASPYAKPFLVALILYAIASVLNPLFLAPNANEFQALLAAAALTLGQVQPTPSPRTNSYTAPERQTRY